MRQDEHRFVTQRKVFFHSLILGMSTKLEKKLKDSFKGDVNSKT